MKQLKSLYNGILNDYSIQRNTMQWQDVISLIEKKIKSPIKKTEEQFEDELLQNAICVSKGKLKSQLISFGRELNINLQTFSEKKRNVGTQRSPFGIGS